MLLWHAAAYCLPFAVNLMLNLSIFITSFQLWFAINLFISFIAPCCYISAVGPWLPLTYSSNSVIIILFITIIIITIFLSVIDGSLHKNTNYFKEAEHPAATEVSLID